MSQKTVSTDIFFVDQFLHKFSFYWLILIIKISSWPNIIRSLSFLCFELLFLCLLIEHRFILAMSGSEVFGIGYSNWDVATTIR